MNLIELKSFVDQAIKSAKDFGDDPSNILVSVQIDDAESETLWADDIELNYDNDGQASGCVLHGWAAKYNKTNAPDREHPAVSNGKSAKEIQKGYRGYLRAHRGR